MMYAGVGEAVYETPLIKLLIAGNSPCSLAFSIFIHWLEQQAGGQPWPCALDQREGCAGALVAAVEEHGWPSVPPAVNESCTLAKTSHHFCLEACGPAVRGTVQSCSALKMQQHPGAQLHRGHPHQLPSCCAPFPPPQPAALIKVLAHAKGPVSHSSVMHLSR